jgi:hypothetical protein
LVIQQREIPPIEEMSRAMREMIIAVACDENLSTPIVGNEQGYMGIVQGYQGNFCRKLLTTTDESARSNSSRQNGDEDERCTGNQD